MPPHGTPKDTHYFGPATRVPRCAANRFWGHSGERVFQSNRDRSDHIADSDDRAQVEHLIVLTLWHYVRIPN